MVAEFIDYQIRVTDAARAQAEIDKLTRALEQSANAERKASLTADQHSQALRATARMSDVMERQQLRANVALEAAASSGAKAAGEAGNFAGAGARVGSILNMVGASATQLDSTIGGLVGSLGRGTLAWNNMAAMVGTGGPWALAVGGAVLAISAFDEVQKALAFDTDAATKAIDDQVRALHESEEALARQAAARNASGAATAKAVVDARTALDRDARGLTPEQQRQLEEVNRAESVANDAGQIRESAAGRKATEKPATDPQAAAREFANKEQIAALRAQEAESKDKLRRYDELPEAIDKAAGDRRLEDIRRQTNEEREIAKAASEERKELRRQEAEEYERLDAQTLQRQQMLRDTGQEAFQAIGAASLTAAAQSAVSGKNMLKAVAAALGGVLIADGVKNEMAGIGRAIFSYGLDPTSEALIAIGAAEIAAGVAFGAAGSDSGKGSKGAGGGGAGGARKPAFTDARTGQPVYDDGLGPASPTLVAPSKSTGSQQTNVYNFNSTFAPRPEDAIQMKRTAEQGARQGYT